MTSNYEEEDLKNDINKIISKESDINKSFILMEDSISEKYKSIEQS